MITPLEGCEVTAVSKRFSELEIVFDHCRSVVVYGRYSISDVDALDPQINSVLKSLVGRTVVRVVASDDELTILFSGGNTFTHEKSAAYEFFPNEYDGYFPEEFQPSMELTDAFSASQIMSERLAARAEESLKPVGFRTKVRDAVCDSIGDLPGYKWQWAICKESTQGADIFKSKLLASYRQDTPSPRNASVAIKWAVEIFRKGQSSWYSNSGEISKPFKDICANGFEALLQEAVAQTETALQGKAQVNDSSSETNADIIYLLQKSLVQLALPADSQLQYLRSIFGSRPISVDELALEFDDVWQAAAKRRPQLGETLSKIDSTFKELTSTSPTVWSVEALQNDPLWANIRTVAANALRLLADC